MFIFSGHAGISFRFALFFQTRLPKAIVLAGSVTMAISALLTRSHYTVDMVSAHGGIRPLPRSDFGSHPASEQSEKYMPVPELNSLPVSPVVRRF